MAREGEAGMGEGQGGAVGAHVDASLRTACRILNAKRIV